MKSNLRPNTSSPPNSARLRSYDCQKLPIRLPLPSASAAVSPRTRVLVADDHEMVRRGIREVINSERDMEVCAEAGNGREAVALALVNEPDVVVMDHSMPELNGAEATRQIRRALPRAEVLIFTAFEDEKAIRDVLLAGARGWICKAEPASRIIAAIRTLMRREPFIAPVVAEQLLQAYLDGAGNHDSARLTSREMEVLQLLAEGKVGKEIAARLAISARTVETHRANIMCKLDLRSMSDLVRYATTHGIIQP